MIFEVRKGRECSVIQHLQKDVITKQGAELLQTSKALELSNRYSYTQGLEIEELRNVIIKGNQANAVEVKQAKRKGMRNGLGVGVVAVILVLLL